MLYVNSNDTVPIEVVITREKRQNIKLQAKPSLLIVKAPEHATEDDISSFIMLNEAWIRKNCKPNNLGYMLLGTTIDWSLTTHGLTTIPADAPPTQRSRIHRRLCHEVIEAQYALTMRHLGLQSIPLRIASLASAWGKCHSSGRIEIHWHAGTLPAHLLDYIISHEVAHRTHFDHSQKFWAHLDSIHPNARKHDRELNNWTLP
jgi:predicted metal-dependent hydrolase